MQALITSIQPYLTAIKDLATIISLAIAAFVAVQGLKTWRTQLKGTAEYDLAKRVLKAVYRLRDALAYVRDPIMTAGEIQSAIKETQLDLKDLKSSDPQFVSASTAAAYQLRWKRVVEAFKDLELEALEVEALWGKPARDTIIAVRKSVNSLAVALELYLMDMQNPDKRILDNESRERTERIVYRMRQKEEEDDFLKDLSTALTSIEQLARPYLAK